MAPPCSRDYYDISVAVSTPKGLVVPVLRDVDTLSFADVEKVGAAGRGVAAREWRCWPRAAGLGNGWRGGRREGQAGGPARVSLAAVLLNHVLHPMNPALPTPKHPTENQRLWAQGARRHTVH